MKIYEHPLFGHGFGGTRTLNPVLKNNEPHVIHQVIHQLLELGICLTVMWLRAR